jgi:hypothetical protein
LILTDYVRDWQKGVITSSKSIYVSLKFTIGEAFHFNWSGELLIIGGIYRKIQVARQSCVFPFFLFKTNSGNAV